MLWDQTELLRTTRKSDEVGGLLLLWLYLMEKVHTIMMAGKIGTEESPWLLTL